MRTEKEVRKAISHLAEAMLAAPEEERDGPTYRAAYLTFQALTWVINHPDGKEFGDMISGFEQIDAMLAGLTGTVQ